MKDVGPILAYLATLAAIVILSLAAAIVCVKIEPDTHLPQIIAALGFISAAVTGLIGVIGTFRPKAQPDAPVPPAADPAPKGDEE